MDSIAEKCYQENMPSRSLDNPRISPISRLTSLLGHRLVWGSLALSGIVQLILEIAYTYDYATSTAWVPNLFVLALILFAPLVPLAAGAWVAMLIWLGLSGEWSHPRITGLVIGVALTFAGWGVQVALAEIAQALRYTYL